MRVPLLSAVGAWALVATSAAAQPAAEEDEAPALDETTKACVDAFGAAQTLRKEGRLRASRAQLLICAQPECPSLLTDKCIPWLAEVQAAIPSIVVVATDPEGHDTTEVRVTMDGMVLAEEVTGRAIDVDPGARQFRFDHPQALAIEQQLVIVEGDKGRRVELRFEAPPAPQPVAPVPAPAWRPPPDAPPRGMHPLFWVGVTVGAVGLTVGTVTGVVAIAQADDIRERCGEPPCPIALEEDYDTGIAFAHASTASFIIGGAGALLALGAWLFDDGPPAGARLTPRGVALQF